MKNETGFSLIELIIVCLVIAILATASIPAIQRNLQLYKLESISGLLSNHLTEAKLTAVKRNTSAQLRVNTTTRTLEILTKDSSGNFTVRTGNVIPIPREALIDITATTQVTFNSLGRNQAPTNSILKFSLSGTNNCRSIIVSAVGNIKITPSC